LWRSREYRAIRRRIASGQPTDTWQEDDLHFFIFQLREDKRLDYTPFDPAVAVFVMTVGSNQPFSAVTVEPGRDGQEIVIDLRAPRTIWGRVVQHVSFAAQSMMKPWNARLPRFTGRPSGAAPERESGW
jgi:hypothetical protein